MCSMRSTLPFMPPMWGSGPPDRRHERGRARSAGVEGGAHEAEGRGAEREQGAVEAVVGVALAPAGHGLVAEREDLELAPRVAAVGRVERPTVRLGLGRRSLQEGVVL